MNVEYKILKSNIIKACRQAQKESIKFLVNYDKLSRSVDDMGLTMINVGTKSDHVKPNDITLLSEYFKGAQLSWFNDYREYTVLAFIETESIDEECEVLLENMNKALIDDPDNDKVKSLATILAKYPCYLAAVVSYMSNDPIRIGKPSYEIKCRANTVTIKSNNYKYNPEDMV